MSSGRGGGGTCAAGRDATGTSCQHWSNPMTADMSSEAETSAITFHIRHDDPVLSIDRAIGHLMRIREDLESGRETPLLDAIQYGFTDDDIPRPPVD